MLVNSRSLEFVLKYRFVSPLLMTLIMVGGGMRMHGCIIVYWLVLCGYIRLRVGFC